MDSYPTHHDNSYHFEIANHPNHLTAQSHILPHTIPAPLNIHGRQGYVPQGTILHHDTLHQGPIMSNHQAIGTTYQ